MSDRIEIKVPDIGDFSDIPVIELLVAEGDRVDAEDGLITLESDKATMEVPSPSAGVIRELKVKIDDTVSEGDVVAILEIEAAEDADGAADVAESPAPEAPADETGESAESVEEPPSEAGQDTAPEEDTGSGQQARQAVAGDERLSRAGRQEESVPRGARDRESLARVAERAGLVLEGPHCAILVRGDDRLGELRPTRRGRDRPAVPHGGATRRGDHLRHLGLERLHDRLGFGHQRRVGGDTETHLSRVAQDADSQTDLPILGYPELYQN